MVKKKKNRKPIFHAGRKGIVGRIDLIIDKAWLRFGKVKNGKASWF